MHKVTACLFNSASSRCEFGYPFNDLHPIKSPLKQCRWHTSNSSTSQNSSKLTQNYHLLSPSTLLLPTGQFHPPDISEGRGNDRLLDGKKTAGHPGGKMSTNLDSDLPPGLTQNLLTLKLW